MVVQHNLQAMNANRMLGVTTGAQGKSTEKLSSGYRINRAADDAAGLSISEKMRKQMKGLDRASTNAADGVSAVQTAEGALNEVHSMLQRMNELATQAANGTNSQSDREAIQAEIKQLTTEIDRVAETTKFNETFLLKGSPDGQVHNEQIPARDAGIAGVKIENQADGIQKVTLKTLNTKDKITVAGKEIEVVADYTSFSGADNTAKKATANAEGKYTVADAYLLQATEIKTASSIGADTDAVVALDNDGTGAYAGASATFYLKNATANNVPNDLQFNLHVGSDADMNNKITVNIEIMSASNLGIKDLDVVGSGDDGGIAATYAIDAIADAISKVSSQRSALGAIQNRLEHTISNLDNVVENTTAAESRIRDTDMAEEMVEYSKNNILMQAGQSMLAQANQATQGVLSLLQ